MKVYELMDKLEKYPAGAEVKFNRIFSEEEIEAWTAYNGEIEFTLTIRDMELRNIFGDSNVVYLDGWEE